MAQTYTLDEAATRLAMSTEEFKRRLKDEWKQIRSFRDGATLRFRSADIDELARVMGEASDPGLQPTDAPAAKTIDSSDDFLLSPDMPAAGPASGIYRPEKSSGDFVLPTPEPSSPKVGKPKPNLKPPSDSDIKIEPGAVAKKSDDDLSLPTEEISLDLSGPGSAIIKPGQSGKLQAPKSSAKLQPPKSSGVKLGPPSPSKIPGPGSMPTNPLDGSSEFELSLDADSDSFELELTGKGTDDAGLDTFELAPPGEGQGHGGLSGINLGKPADSGVSLEAGSPKSGPKKSTPLGPKSSKILPKPPSKPPATSAGSANPTSDSDVDFELAIDSGGGRGTSRLDSDSEFELTLDDSGTRTALPGDPPKTHGGAASRGGGDIYETDFELPSMGDDSASEVLELDEEASSEFDLAISDADVQADDAESASEVVMLDDELGEAALVSDDESEPHGPLSGVARGARRSRRDEVEDEEDEDEVEPVRTVAAPPAQWGTLPAAVLLPTLLFVFLGGLMSFEMLRGMWGYHQPSKPSSMLLRGMAETFLGMKSVD